MALPPNLSACLLRLALLGACLLPAARAAEPFPANATYTVAFSPGNAIGVVVSAIREAKATIYVAAYSFTSRAVAAELHQASKRSVQVFVVADAADAGKGYSAVRYLANQGVPVRVNARHAIQHNKFMVIDDVTVQTGSFNYTSSAAERNAENVLVIRGAPQLARAYSDEWRRLWDGGTDLPPAY
jgi:phosphatidylserine/phosphatidylglycerophosphate/cardiolipin synthase-like enzyme